MAPAEFEVGRLEIIDGQRHFGRDPKEVKAGKTEEEVFAHRNEDLEVSITCDNEDSGSLISYTYAPYDIKLSLFGLNLKLALKEEPREGTKVIKTGETFTKAFRSKSGEMIGFRVTQKPEQTKAH